MSLPRSGLAAILFCLYLTAVWGRLDNVGGPGYPYYTGESGTNYRQANQIAARGTLPETDERAAWPDGYSPSRVKANGAEYFTGFAYRLVRPFSDIPEKRFASLLTVLFFSLLVFTVYDLTHKTWRCQAAGLWAAFLTALSAPLIDVTDGREFLHITFAVVVVSVHLTAYLRYRSRSSATVMTVVGVTGFLVFAIWEAAGFYIVGISLLCLLDPALERAPRQRILAVHLVTIILAGLLLPHLRAQRFVFAWPSVWLFVTAAFTALGHRLPQRVPGWAYIGGAFVVLTLMLRPIQSGGIEMASPLQYWLYRLRFIAGKPEDPTLLPEAVRLLWTSDHAPPRTYQIVAFFLPLIFLVPSVIGALRDIRREKAAPVSIPFFLLIAGLFLFLIDRRSTPVAALLVFPFLSVACRGAGEHLRTRAVPLALSAFLVMTGSSLTPVTLNSNRAIAHLAGIPVLGTAGFRRVSIGNADRETLRYIVSRTSTRKDVFLAVPEVSPLIPTFAGRAAVLAPGIHEISMTRKITDAVSRFFGDEEALYAVCETLGVTHVLYSVDLLLDSTVYSPRYVVGLTDVDENSVAFEMHFAPQSLRHFQLVYENDNYRLFRVVAEPQPVFLTDHPPVYQHDILRVHGDDLDSFYNRIVDILATYQLAVEAQVRGDEQGAIRRFRYCLDQAPFFTKARLGIGDSLLRLEDYKAASDAFKSVLEYSPDDPHALYNAALSLSSIGQTEEALALLDLLLSATPDREIRSQALGLKSELETTEPTP